jgi:hypothetical protein
MRAACSVGLRKLKKWDKAEAALDQLTADPRPKRAHPGSRTARNVAQALRTAA